MKTLILLVIISRSFFLFGQTQTQLNDQSSKALKKAETELNSVFNQILKTYQNDAEFIKNLKNSQEIWTKFRAAELKAKYPDREPGYYGSVHAMCVNDYLTELTLERTKRLRVWITGAVEGDVCSGSVKIKNED